MTKYTPQRLFEMMNKVSGMPLTEVDWENDFSDVYKECMSTEDLKNYLNNILANHQKPENQRVKSTLLIHNKVIPFDEKGDIDVDTFINDITKIPSQIISKNAKMEKSETDDSIVYNIGIPALQGLVYDINQKNFYNVTTCPGAGSCIKVCYARRGRYVIQPNIFLKQTRILNLLLNYPGKFEKILKLELETIAMKNSNKRLIFRWNDAGDFFSAKYFEIAVRITKQLNMDGYRFESYAHTKMGDIFNLKDPNITLNFSVDSNKKERDKVNILSAKTSEIVPRSLFNDLFVKKGPHLQVNDDDKLIPLNVNSIATLKQRISDKYNVDVNSLLTYDELLKKPANNGKLVNVIVMPKGDGDVSAQRNDVQRTFLLYH